MRDDVLRIGVRYEESVIEVQDSCSVVDQVVRNVRNASTAREVVRIVRNASTGTFAKSIEHRNVHKATTFANTANMLANKGTLSRGRASDTYMQKF